MENKVKIRNRSGFQKKKGKEITDCIKSEMKTFVAHLIKMFLNVPFICCSVTKYPIIKCGLN